MSIGRAEHSLCLVGSLQCRQCLVPTITVNTWKQLFLNHSSEITESEEGPPLLNPNFPESGVKKKQHIWQRARERGRERERGKERERRERKKEREESFFSRVLSVA